MSEPFFPLTWQRKHEGGHVHASPLCLKFAYMHSCLCTVEECGPPHLKHMTNNVGRLHEAIVWPCCRHLSHWEKGGRLTNFSHRTYFPYMWMRLLRMNSVAEPAGSKKSHTMEAEKWRSPVIGFVSFMAAGERSQRGGRIVGWLVHAGLRVNSSARSVSGWGSPSSVQMIGTPWKIRDRYPATGTPRAPGPKGRQRISSYLEMSYAWIFPANLKTRFFR